MKLTKEQLIKNIEEKEKEVILLSDIDGVTIDWLEGFIKYCESIGHKALHNEPKVFAMTDIFPDLEKPWVHIMDYQHSPYYDEIKAYPEVVEVYNKLHDMGVKIIFVTSCGTTEHIKEARNKVMEKEFNGKYEHIEYLDFGASKTEILNKYPNATYIDDQMKMSIEGAESGHDSFIKDMSYNREDSDERVKRLYSFKDLIPHFQKKLGINSNNTRKLKIKN